MVLYKRIQKKRLVYIVIMLERGDDDDDDAADDGDDVADDDDVDAADDGDDVVDDDDDDDGDDDNDKGVESKVPWASCGKFKMCAQLLQRFHFHGMKRSVMMMVMMTMMMTIIIVMTLTIMVVLMVMLMMLIINTKIVVVEIQRRKVYKVCFFTRMLMVMVTMGIVMVVGTMNGGEIQKAPTADFTEAKMKPSNMQKMSAWL